MFKRVDRAGVLEAPRWRTPGVLRNPLALIGLVVLTAWLLIAVFASALPLADPYATSGDRLLPPSASHLFGTDNLGRDLLSRVLYGAQISIPIAVLLVALSLTLGGVVGALAGYFGGVVDETIMRITDLVFTLPAIILAMVVMAALGPSLQNAVLAMLIVTWPPYARITRSLVQSLKSSEFVLANRLLGYSIWRSLRVDVLPNIAGSLLVLAMLDVGAAILLLAGLSYLGLGAVPPTPEWGSLISAGTSHMTSWWLAVFPGLAIITVTLAVNFIGDALRDILDPHLQQERMAR